MKKTILTIGTLTVSLAPMATVIACGSKPKPDHSEGIYITYFPNVDPAIALGAKIAASSKSSGHFATWFPKDSKYEKVLNSIKEIKPLWDADTMDEEYWRNLNGGEKVNLVHEYWIKNPQKEFLKSDSKINPIEFDYNAGKSGQKYEWAIEGVSGNSPTKILLQNKGKNNYETPNDLWQIRDMGAILNTAANALDNASDNLSKKQFAKKAEQVIKETNTHWANFRILQEKYNNLPSFTDSQLKERQMNLSSKRENDPRTGSSEDDPRLLILNIKTGVASAGSNDTIAFSTPSIAQEAYTKTHFTMPSLSMQQFNILKTYNNLDENGNAKMSSTTNNGIYFPNYKGNPLNMDFWSEWKGDVDKLVVGISHEELLAHVENSNYFYDLYNSEKDKISSTGNILTQLVGNDLSPENTIFMDTYLAGSGSYGFRMPIGQNVFIDKISKTFYNNWQYKI